MEERQRSMKPTSRCPCPIACRNFFRLLFEAEPEIGFFAYKKVAAQKDGHLCIGKLFELFYFLRKRRAMPREPSAAPSNITVVPPSGTWPPGEPKKEM